MKDIKLSLKHRLAIQLVNWAYHLGFVEAMDIVNNDLLTSVKEVRNLIEKSWQAAAKVTLDNHAKKIAENLKSLNESYPTIEEVNDNMRDKLEDDMTEGDIWNKAREESQLRRLGNRNKSAGLLNEYGIRFIEKNGGAHLIIRHQRYTVDFWPGTGRYIFRPDGTAKFGVFNLLKDLGITLEGKHVNQNRNQKRYNQNRD